MVKVEVAEGGGGEGERERWGWGGMERGKGGEGGMEGGREGERNRLEPHTSSTCIMHLIITQSRCSVSDVPVSVM